MRTLVPPFILAQSARGQTAGSFDAVALFADTSGFTPLTTALMAHGAEGAEVIASTLTAIFQPLIAIIHQHGGFVAAFAGDALKAIFPAQPDAALRALTAAWRIHRHMAAHPHIATPYGAFDFAIKTTLAHGQVDWAIWQGGTGEQRRTALFEGEALAQCLEADPFAGPGEIVITPQLWAEIPAGTGAVVAAGDYLRLETFRAPTFDPDPEPPAPAADLYPAQGFHPASLHAMTAQGEFRVVTTVFINLQTLPQDPAFHNILFTSLDQYGGYLCRIGRIGERDRGGTLLLFWGAPTRREHDAERALGFLLDLQAACPVPLRAGVTTGMAYAGFVGAAQREEYTCHGSTVNLAARQMVTAGWGEIWLDDETARLTRHNFHAPEKGRYPMKGFAEPRRVHLLAGRRAIAETALHRWELAGRSGELAQLRAALQPVLEGRFGGVITLRGEAGIGKSRLVYELQTSEVLKTSEVSAMWATCQTDDILRHSLHPFRYWLVRYFNQSGEAGEAANRAAFEARLDSLLAAADPELSAELERTRSFLAALVNLHTPGSLHAQLDPKGRFENTLSALKTLVKAESLRQPLVLVIEDSHWLDADSREFLGVLTRNVEAYPFVILAATRPEGEPIPGADSAPQGSATPGKVFELGQLSRESLAGLAAGMLGSPPSESVLDLLEQRAEGNPFFAEQILLHLQSGQALPDDVRTVLVARIDRLAQGVKEVVQTAAVLGREFEVRLLAAVLRGQDVAGEVATAEQAEIWSALAELRYLFKHALLRDAAYEMQLAARRRELHRAAGEALEVLYAARLEARYGELAYHFEKAGELPRAIFYLVRAGAAAQADYQNEAALELKSRAVALLAEAMADAQRRTLENLLGASIVETSLRLRLDMIEINLRTGKTAPAERMARELVEDAQAKEFEALRTLAKKYLGQLEEGRGQYDAALEVFHEALNIYRALGDTTGESDLLNEIGFVHFRLGEYTRALEFYNQAIGLARKNGQAEGVGKNLGHIAMILGNTGQYADAEQHYQDAAAIYQQLNNPERIAALTGNRGVNFFRSGDYKKAREMYEEALALDIKLGRASGIGINLGNIGIMHWYAYEYDKCLDFYGKALAIARETGNKVDEARHLGNMGMVYQHLGELELAGQHLTTGLEMSRDAKNKNAMLSLLSNLGDFYRRIGKPVQAETLLEEALTLIEELQEEYFLADVLVCQGRIKFAVGKYALAQEYFEKALDTAEKHHNEEQSFISRLFVQKIRFQQGEPDAAREAVRHMLTEAPAPRQQALTHLELWRMGAGEAHRAAAIALCTHLFGETKDVEYREYLEELDAPTA